MCRELRFAQLVELVRICRRKVEVIVIQDSLEAATSFGDVPLPMNKRIAGRSFPCEGPAMVEFTSLAPAVRENDANVRRTRRAARTSTARFERIGPGRQWCFSLRPQPRGFVQVLNSNGFPQWLVSACGPRSRYECERRKRRKSGMSGSADGDQKNGSAAR